MKKAVSRTLSLLLTACLLLGMLPAGALAEGETTHVVINQAYGGGGNSGAEYKHDFIELYNPTDSDISLDGWSVQYTSKAGSSFSATPLSGTIKAKSFYLIQEAAGSGGTKGLPTPDATGSIAMAGKEFKLALVNSTTAISGKDDASVIDFLGVGGANEYEGNGAAPTISNTTAACRKVDGVDTNDNAADFEAGTPNPRNSGGAEAPTKVANPKAAPAGGSTVEQGSTVTFTCDTEGATVYVSTNYTDDSDATNDTWTAATTYTLPGEAWDGDHTVYVKATKDGLTDSAVVALKYKYKAPATQATIAEVRAAASGKFVVAGTVILLDGKNVVIQDATGGINLYCSAAPTGLALGDTVEGTGTRGEYKGLLQLTGATVEKTGSGSLPTPADITIADVGESYESQRIKITAAKVTAISGTTVTLSQGEGDEAKTTTIFKCPTKENLTEGDTVTVTAVVSQYDAYQLRVSSAADIDITDDTAPEEPPTPPTPAETFYKPADGDVVAIYYPNSGLVLTATASGTRLKGTAAVAAGNALVVDGSELRFTASIDTDGNYTFTAPDGKVLNTGATGNNLTLVDAGQATAAKWAVESIDGGWTIRSTEANYGGSYNQCIEVYSGNFTTYGYKEADKAIFTMRFFKELVIPSTVESDVEETVAAWGGASQLADTDRAVKGDLFETGDMKDDSAVYTAVVSGAAVKPFTTGTGTGGTVYYMGGTGIGSGSDDYIQLAMPAAGWGDMELSFRLRASNTGPGTFQLQYSTNGTDFVNFANGSYEYGYTQYDSTGLVDSGTRSGTITDGIARTSLNPGAYVSFTFDVPVGAENAANLLIRLVPGTTRAKGDGTPTSSGTVRMDSVVLSGHPILSDTVTGYVDVQPDGKEEDQAAGTELTLTSATAGAVISYRFNGEGAFQTYDAAAKPKLPDTLPAHLEVYATAPGKAQSVKRVFTYAAGTVATVKMDPNGGGVYIAAADGSAQITLSCATEGATIYYSDTGEAPEDYKAYTAPITLTKGFGSKTIRAYATKAGFSNSAVTSRTFTERSTAEYSLYFGQIHSHTNYSDGAGSCDEAFTHAAGLSENWNIDFLAVTDHSNSFDNADAASIADGSMSAEWVEGHQLADSHSTAKFTGIYGYEMTWSNGLGHMNTFNSPGFQSRTQSAFTTYSTALQNYYAALKTQPGSISQFNHPGTTFGDFSDFAHYDEELDNLITLVEVGNGEGAIGSSGYFPSYEYYTRALDKGWHVAPTNNQDNHKGNWGDANTGRTVVLADSLERGSIYDAMRNYRTYATEDLNLEIRYTLDGSVMGTILDGASGDTAHIQVALADADDTGSAKVQVIVNGGLVAAEKTATCNETVTFDVPSTYAYYYIKVVQADGDIAVTAPVWLGKVEAVGVGSMTARNAITVAGEEQTIDLSLYNNENKALEVTSIVFTDKATGEVLHRDNTITSVRKLGAAECSFTHSFAQDGKVTIRATVTGSLKGVAKTYTQDLELTVMPAEMVRTVIVDGTHYNDYVTGYYGGNMNNMTTIAAGVGVQVKVIPAGETITAEMLDNCALLVLAAPAKKADTANAGDYVPTAYEDSFLELVKTYVAEGGKVAVCGLADYQDGGKDTVYHASVQQNKLLAAIGSTLKINDDEVIDNEHNGGQPFRLYPEKFAEDSRWTRGLVTQADVAEGASYQTYSQYSGCSVDPGQGEALVMGFDTTWGADSDKDGVDVLEGKSYTYQFNNKDYTLNAVVDKGSVVFLAAEDVGAGTVFAAGGVFLSDFEVKAELDNIWDLPYANRTIYENILKAVREDVEATPIATIRKAELNRIFVAEGYVTSGTTDPNTTFFDAIYIQDETGGITVFPYAQSGLAIGTKVRIIGYTDAYQGDRELQISSLEILDDEPKVYEPTVLTTAQAADYDTNGGLLVKTQGTVSNIVLSGGVVAQFCLTDDTGVAATVFIDGYITNPEGQNTIGEWLKDGCEVSAVGLNYLHPEGDSDVSVPVLRVRNCDEIELLAEAPAPYFSFRKPTNNKPNETATVTDPDTGVVTKTEVDGKTGAVTETVTYPSGAQVKSVTTTDGETTLSATLPKQLDAAVVTVPAKEVKPGDVVVLTKADGTEEVLTCVPEEAGLLTLLTDGGALRVEDRSADFVDVHDDDWFAGDVDFVSARGILNGTGESTFSPLEPTTRAMVMTVLARMNGQDTSTGETWDAVGVKWAMDNGVSDGANTDQVITREQLAVMLWRYAGSPAATAGLDAFQDNGQANDWAVDGLRWAVENGLLQGDQLGNLMPGGSATRSQLSAVLRRFQSYMLKTQA